MTRVCAFVLTRDRPELLAECVAGLLAQTRPVDRIVVLDNAGTRPLPALDPRVEVHRAEVNTGGAGGYAAGRELALATGADWIWFMDDDAEPAPDALEHLLAAPAAEGAAAVCTAVVHPGGALDLMHRCRLGRFVTPLPAEAYAHAGAEVELASFVGLLVRAEAARAAGPIRAELFLGYDDADWSLRLRACCGPIRLVPASRMVHKIAIGGGEATRRAALWNRVLGQAYASTPWPAYWKDLYRVRNLMWIKRAEPAHEAALVLLGYVAKTLMYEPRPLRRLPWLVRYALKGRRGDFRAIAPDAWQRLA